MLADDLSSCTTEAVGLISMIIWNGAESAVATYAKVG